MSSYTRAERKYALTRVSAGDYLAPSNDGQTLWRIYSYVEDGSAEVSSDGKKWRKVTGTWWAAARYKQPLPSGGELPDDFLEWGNWDVWATGLRTKREALGEVPW